MRLFLEVGEGIKRPRALWRLLAQFVVFQTGAVLFATPLAAMWFALASPSVAPGDAGTNLSRTPAIFVIGGVASLISIFISVWLAARYLDKRPFTDFGLRLHGGWWLDLLFGMALGALLMTAIFLIELAAGWITVAGTLRSTIPDTPFALAILVPVVTFLCIGVYEELLSRGYQLRNMAEGLNYPVLGPRGAIVAAWALSSTLFGALHVFNPNATVISTFNIALAGLLLGTGYVLTGELAIPIGLHITWNFFQGNVYGFPVSGLDPVGATFISIRQSGPDLWTGGAFGPEAGLLDPAAALAGGLLILLWVRLRRGRANIHTPIAETPKRTATTKEANDDHAP